MQLREIHIDGFGIFHNKRIVGLSSGIHVIYGRHEVGKTTLLNFVRRILFGFPTTSPKINPYPALEGGAYGGRLVCQLANGEIVTVSRTQGPRGGPVEIYVDSTKSTDQKQLNNILGNIGGGFYQNVYAISLDELAQEGLLEKDEDVRSHIYGAGLGLRNISLKDIRDEFTDRAKEVFKPAGRTQKIPELYKEILELEQEIRQIKEDLSKYDALVSQLDGLENEVKSLNQQIITLEEDKRKLENQNKLYQDWVKLSDDVINLSRLEEVPDFTESALSKLETLKGNITILDGQIEGETGELTDLEFERDQCVYDEQIILKEQDILILLKKSEDFRKASTDIEKIETERNEHQRVVREGIERIGHGWTKESVRDFNLSILQKDTIRKTQTKLYDVERQLQGQSKGLTAPTILKYLIYFVTALGLICAVSGFVAAQTLVAVLSTTIFVVGIGLILFMELLGRPEQEYQKLLQDKEILLVEWRDFLESINFNRDLTPDGANDLVHEINSVRTELRLLDTAEKRIAGMQATINEVKDLHDQVAVCFDKSDITDNMSANIDIFNRILNEAKQTKGAKQGFERQIAEKIRKIESIKTKKGLAEEKLQSYISSLGAKDENDFRLKYQTFTDRKELQEAIDTSIKIIQSTVGMGEHFDSLIEAISLTNPTEIENSLQEVKGRLEKLDEQRQEVDREIGEKRNEIKRLSTSEELLMKLSDLEILKQKLRDHTSDWVKTQIALFVLEKAISRYESTRQPEVIKAAQNIFSNITDHRYSTIIVPAGTDDFTIRDSSGKSKTVKEMSKGTKEQLYFAMRLGLISVYEAEKEPMPIIMDDILVNFDDDRGPLAIKELAKFAEKRQVIILTCHKNTLDLYKSLGAKEITFG